MIVDDLPKRKVMLKKLKAGLIENEVTSYYDEDFNINSDVINVHKAIDTLNAKDLDVEKIMEYDQGSTNENNYCDVSDQNKYLDVSDENSGASAANYCHDVQRNCVKVHQAGSNEEFMVEQRKRQRIEDKFLL